MNLAMQFQNWFPRQAPTRPSEPYISPLSILPACCLPPRLALSSLETLLDSISTQKRVSYATY